MSEREQPRAKGGTISGRVIAWAVAAIVGVWAISALLVMAFIGPWSDRAAFGDLFGAVNSLFSGLAFAGVIVTILLQQQELRLQRLELELTREELKRAASAQEKSQQALRQQARLMASTARLSALTAVIGQVPWKLNNAQSVVETEKVQREQERFVRQLEHELTELGKMTAEWGL